MKDINVWETKLIDNFTYCNDIDTLIDLIRKNKIRNFNVIDKYGVDDKSSINNFYLKKINLNFNKNNLRLIYCDKKHYSFIIDDDLFLSEEFYYKYKAMIDSLISKNILDSTFIAYVNNHIYNDKLVKELANKGCKFKFDNDLLLSKEIIEYLKSKHVESYYYNGYEKILISDDKILGHLYADVINTNKDKIRLNPNITDLENLKYIPSNKEIIIESNYPYDKEIYEQEYYDNIHNIVKTLKNNNLNNKITVNITNRKKFVESKLFMSDYDIIIKGLSLSDYSLEELKKEENMLDLMVKDIKDSNYSPFEKYIAVYNIVKKFKQYKENNEHKEQARRVNYILDNEYMVCVGYSALLKELLRKIGINSYEYSVGIDTSYDDGFSQEEKEVTYDGHARLIVRIEDPKYNINGLYVSDPTWDNNLTYDYYNHALISFDKTSKEKRFFYLSDEDLILNNKSMEEFSYKINYFIKNEINNKKKFRYNLKPDSKDYKEFEIDAYKTLIDKIVKILVKLYPLEYDNLFKKYYDNFSYNISIDDAVSFLSIAGNFFVKNLGKDVSIDDILEAAINVNKNVFNFNLEELKTYKEELISINKEREIKSFPLYYEEEKSKVI